MRCCRSGSHQLFFDRQDLRLKTRCDYLFGGTSNPDEGVVMAPDFEYTALAFYFLSNETCIELGVSKRVGTYSASFVTFRRGTPYLCITSAPFCANSQPISVDKRLLIMGHLRFALLVLGRRDCCHSLKSRCRFCCHPWFVCWKRDLKHEEGVQMKTLDVTDRQLGDEWWHP